MRTFSANQNTLLALDDINAFYLVSIAATSGTTYDTTAAFDITIPTLGTFSAGTGLLTVEPPRLSKAVDRETYKVVYIDSLFEKRAMFEAGLTGADVTVYLCFENTTAGNLTSGGVVIAPGGILTGIEDLLVVYAGTVDTQGYAIEPSEGKVVAVIEGSSPMAALSLSKPFFTSKDAMKQIYTGDTSFDQVFIGSKKIMHLWGK